MGNPQNEKEKRRIKRRGTGDDRRTTRLKILHTLGDAEMNVTDIVAATSTGQANVSKHLGVMLDAGLVSRRKEGLNSIYRVSDETIFELCEVVCSRLKKQMETRQNALTGIF
jgi:DNA-binding transcriptional ArsR family regulator